MQNNDTLEIRSKSIRKSNDLITKSRFDLSIQQQKILLYIIAQIKPYDEDFKTYSFSIQEFCRVCGISSSGKNYSDLKAAIKGIRDKSVWVTMPDGKESLLAWIEKAKIDGGNGTVEIRLDDDLKPFLLQLKENYTQYELIYTLNFQSKYTIRLYELIKCIHYHDLERYSRVYSISELKTLLGAETYKTTQHFKDRVIAPSVSEINEYSDKMVSYSFIKTGRAYTDIEFTIWSKETLEALKIRDAIEKRMGVSQMTFYDELQELGYIPQRGQDVEAREPDSPGAP